MNTKQLLIFFSILLTALNISSQENPNVLFIAIDDLNDYVNSMNGSIKVPTPNIDRLAQKGTLFTNAHCQAPICGPSRASVMTGLYPSTSGNYFQLKDINIKKASKAASEAIFMPDYFEQHGYKSMGVGKIYHHGDAAHTFDEYGGRFSLYGPKPKVRFKYNPAEIEHKVGNTQTDWGVYPKQDSLMTDYKSARWAVNKLQQKHNKPFFLGVGFVRPHVPWYAPQKWFDMFPLDSIKTPPYKKDDFDDISSFAKKVTDAPQMPTTEELIKSGEWKKALQAYMACIAFVDAQVGKVLDALENSEYANNTIIVLWADHGHHLGEKNRFAKQALWERDTRTLLIIKGVNESKSNRKICTSPVQLLDIYPTLIDMCKLPSSKLLEGHSLTNLLLNPNEKWTHPSLTFYGEGNVAIRDKQFRLIKYEDGSNELYDMKNDPNEWNNLAHKTKYKKTINRLIEYIPKEWAPTSEHNNYSFNAYFKKKIRRDKKRVRE